MTLAVIVQLAIGLLGVLSVFLTQHRSESARRWVCVPALVAQPFWFYTSYVAGQWGVFVLGFLYAFIWSRAFWFNWIKRNPTQPLENQ